MNSDIDAVRDAELRYAQLLHRVPIRRVVIEVRLSALTRSMDLLDRA